MDKAERVEFLRRRFKAQVKPPVPPRPEKAEREILEREIVERPSWRITPPYGLSRPAARV